MNPPPAQAEEYRKISHDLKILEEILERYDNASQI